MNTKVMKKLLVTTMTICLLSLPQFVAAQGDLKKDLKKIDDSGNKPHWVNWSRGKTFKRLPAHRATKIKLEKGDEVYLFVATAQEIAHNGKTEVYSLDDAKSMAALNASKDFAAILKQEIDAVVSNDVTIANEEKERLFQRTEKMLTAAKFSGFARVANYWEKGLDRATGKTYWDVYYLYSINKSKVDENLARALAQLDLADKSAQVMAAIVTAAEEADDESVGDF